MANGNNKVDLIKQLKREIADATPADKACKAFGEMLARMVRRLQFWGAGVYEPRGISDAGLSDETALALLWFKLPFDFSTDLVNYLDAEAVID